MSIVRWEPFGEIDSLFNRLMPTMFNRLPARFGSGNGGGNNKLADTSEDGGGGAAAKTGNTGISSGGDADARSAA